MEQIFKAYTISEASRKLGLTTGTLRNWEKYFDETIRIPRYKTGPNEGDRYYTIIELEKLEYIKSERDKNVSLIKIKEDLLDRSNNSSNEITTQPQAPIHQAQITQTLQQIQSSFESLPEVRDIIISDIRHELKEVIQQEMTQEFKRILDSQQREFKMREEAYKLELEKRDKAYKKDIEEREEFLVRFDKALENKKNELDKQRQKEEEEQARGFFSKLSRFFQ